MEQKGGHIEITRAAVHMLLQRSGGDYHQVLGLTETEFFDKLNAAQKKQDAFLGFKTWLPDWCVTWAQEEHALANPWLTGDQNLVANYNYIVSNLQDAWDKESGDPLAMTDREHRYNAMFESLGKAAHALQDSYSRAHVDRDPSRPLDPTAPIVAFNTFDPTQYIQDVIAVMPMVEPTLGQEGQLEETLTHPDPRFWEGTHVPSFDKAAISRSESGMSYLDRAADQQAVLATASILDTFVKTLDSNRADAHATLGNAVQRFFHGQAGGVKVFKDPYDPEFQNVLKRNYEGEVCTNPVSLSEPNGRMIYAAPLRPSTPALLRGQKADQPRSRPLSSPGAIGTPDKRPPNIYGVQLRSRPAAQGVIGDGIRNIPGMAAAPDHQRERARQLQLLQWNRMHPQVPHSAIGSGSSAPLNKGPHLPSRPAVQGGGFPGSMRKSVGPAATHSLDEQRRRALQLKLLNSQRQKHENLALDHVAAIQRTGAKWAAEQRKTPHIAGHLGIGLAPARPGGPLTRGLHNPAGNVPHPIGHPMGHVSPNFAAPNNPGFGGPWVKIGPGFKDLRPPYGMLKAGPAGPNWKALFAGSAKHGGGVQPLPKIKPAFGATIHAGKGIGNPFKVMSLRPGVHSKAVVPNIRRAEPGRPVAAKSEWGYVADIHLGPPMGPAAPWRTTKTVGYSVLAKATGRDSVAHFVGAATPARMAPPKVAQHRVAPARPRGHK